MGIKVMENISNTNSAHIVSEPRFRILDNGKFTELDPRMYPGILTEAALMLGNDFFYVIFDKPANLYTIVLTSAPDFKPCEIAEQFAHAGIEVSTDTLRQLYAHYANKEFRIPVADIHGRVLCASQEALLCPLFEVKIASCHCEN